MFAAAASAAPSYFSQINASSLPDAASGRGIVVAVLDSGVDIDHPDLKDSIWINPGESIYPDGLDNDDNGYIDDIRGWDFTIPSDAGGKDDPRPKYDQPRDAGELSHGTAIAGFIAGRENSFYSTSGLAPQSKIMALRVLSGNGEGDVSQVVSAIKYAVSQGADVINLSFVGFDNSSELRDAVEWAYGRNVVVVAAAGNGMASSSSGVNLNSIPAYPACYGATDAAKRQLLAVASVDRYGKKSIFSNFGSDCISLAAPGEYLRGLAFSASAPDDPFSGYALWSGTSFSAALVSAAAALIKSARPDLPAKQIMDILAGSASDLTPANPFLTSGELGAGMLDISAAMASAMAAHKPRLIKTQTFSAVYFVDSAGVRHVFAGRKIYDSWFKAWKTPPNIEIISQKDFDVIPAGANMTARPGHLIKFNSSPAVYEIQAGSALCRLADSAAGKALFGKNWQSLIINSAAGDMNDYRLDPDCLLASGSTLPAVYVPELISSR